MSGATSDTPSRVPWRHSVTGACWLSQSATSEHLLRKRNGGLAVLGLVVLDIHDDVEGAGVVAADEHVGAVDLISHIRGGGWEPRRPFL